MAGTSETDGMVECRRENERLRQRLQEAEQTLRAIREGEVDSLVVRTPLGNRIFTLVDAQSPYRSFVENMAHGVVGLGPDGVVVYCNRSFSTIIRTPAERVMGAKWRSFLTPESVAECDRLFQRVRAKVEEGLSAELVLRVGDGTCVPVSVSAHALPVGNLPTVGLVVTDLTRPRQVEEAYKLLARMLDESREIMVIDMSPDGAITGWNKGAEYTYGYKASEVIGRPISVIIPPDRADQFAGVLERLRRGDTEVHYDTTRLCKDGQLRTVSVVIGPLKDASGQVVGYGSVTRDVTERKKAEESLREQAELLALSHDAILVLDPADRITYWNKGAEALYGWAREEALGQPAHTLLRTTFPLPVGEIHATLLRQGYWNGELLHVTRDGRPIAVDSRWSLRRDEQGNPAAVMEINSDVTARKQAEEAARLQAECYATLLATTPDGFLLTDLDGNLLDANDTYCRMSGYSRDELLHLRVADLEWRETREEVADRSLKVTQSQFDRFESLHRRKDGSVLPVEVSIAYWKSRGQLLVFVRDIGERIRAAEAARIQAECYTALLAATPDGFWLTDVDGNLLDVNDTYCQMSGHSRDELLRSRIADHELVFTPEGVIERLHQIATATRFDRFETRLYRKGGGGVLEVEVSIAYLQSKDQFVTFIRDIAERNRAEEALRRASAYTRSLIEASLDPLGTVDAEGKITDVNAATERMTGYDRARLIGTHFVDHFTDPEKARSGIEQVFSKGETRDLELDARSRDGQITTVLFNGSVYRDEGGRVLGVFAAARDITARKRAEERLRLSEERYRSLAMATTQIVWTTGPEGKAVAEQPYWEEYTGQTVDEDREFGWLDAVHPDDRDLTMNAWKAACQARRTFRFECRIRRRDGAYRLFANCGVPMLNPDGTIREWVGTCNDITDVREAEAAIRKLNAELERRVEERTAQLEVANKELESFAYSVSHDLRAPLRTVDGFSQALLEDCAERLDGQGKDYLCRIRKASLRMAGLIDDILHLSRTTRAEVNRSRVNLSEVARSVVAALREHEPQRRVDVSIADNLTAVADPPLIQVVLENLLNNAWKFTSKRDPARIEFGCTRDDEGRPVYFVRDNGAGFDMRYADRLFGAFQRLHRSEDYPGNGIGLATVKRIVHKHGGRIWAEAAVDQGATFYFILP